MRNFPFLYFILPVFVAAFLVAALTEYLKLAVKSAIPSIFVLESFKILIAFWSCATESCAVKQRKKIPKIETKMVRIIFCY